MLGAIGGRAPSSAAVEAVYRRSGGIPFVVEELMRGVGPDLCSDDFLTAQLPWSLDEAVRQQLGGLERAERDVVDALAVFGETGVVRHARRADRARRRRPARRAQRARPARTCSSSRRNDHFWFAHALVADAVAQQLLGRQRRLLHQRALEALQAAARCRPCLAGPPRRRRRALRAGRADRPRRRPAVPRRRGLVPGAAPGQPRAGGGARRPRAAARGHRCRVAPRLPRRGAELRPPLAGAGGRRRRSRRGPAVPHPPAPRAGHRCRARQRPRRAGADGRDAARRPGQGPGVRGDRPDHDARPAW